MPRGMPQWGGGVLKFRRIFKKNRVKTHRTKTLFIVPLPTPMRITVLETQCQQLRILFKDFIKPAEELCNRQFLQLVFYKRESGAHLSTSGVSFMCIQWKLILPQGQQLTTAWINPCAKVIPLLLLLFFVLQ